MTEIYIVADYYDVETKYSGLRNKNLVWGVGDSLEKDFIVHRYDCSHVKKKEIALHYIVGQKVEINVLVIQPHCTILNDLPRTKIVYLHIDGAPSVNGTNLRYGMKMYNSNGVHDYKVHEHHKTLYPFVFIDRFNPNREKDILISSIDRNCSFAEYKDILERSCFTILDCYGFLSKRAFQALACKTIPIIITDMPELYHKLGFSTPFVIFNNPGLETSQLILKYQPLVAEKGYKFISKYYSGKRRMKIIKTLLKRIFKSKQ